MKEYDVENSKPNSAAANALRVLLVDDHHDLLSMLQLVLTRRSFQW
jgi:hypothetical protein